jgi:hypothetical protein
MKMIASSWISMEMKSINLVLMEQRYHLAKLISQSTEFT